MSDTKVEWLDELHWAAEELDRINTEVDGIAFACDILGMKEASVVLHEACIAMNRVKNHVRQAARDAVDELYQTAQVGTMSTIDTALALCEHHAKEMQDLEQTP